MIETDWESLSDEFAATPAAITIGVFDGLHRGHLALIREVVDTPHMAVVVTFQRHPTEVLLHDSVPGFIMSLGQKRRMLRELGVDIGVIIDFNERFRRVPGREFLDRLAASFDLRRLVVGHDFRCGYRLDTDINVIREHFHDRGVEVVSVEPVEDGSTPVSSTRVRRLVMEGDVAAAAHLLGRPYVLDLTHEQIECDNGRAYVVKGRGDLLQESSQLLPPPGRYTAVGHAALPPVEPPGADAPARQVADRQAEREMELEIGENSLSWPLAAGESIRYIVVKDRRFSSKE